jgi:hypothetical protein
LYLVCTVVRRYVLQKELVHNYTVLCTESYGLYLVCTAVRRYVLQKELVHNYTVLCTESYGLYQVCTALRRTWYRRNWYIIILFCVEKVTDFIRFVQLYGVLWAAKELVHNYTVLCTESYGVYLDCTALRRYVVQKELVHNYTVLCTESYGVHLVCTVVRRFLGSEGTGT